MYNSERLEFVDGAVIALKKVQPASRARVRPSRAARETAVVAALLAGRAPTKKTNPAQMWSTFIYISIIVSQFLLFMENGCSD